MAKPDLIKWVSGDEAAKITDPGSSKKLSGFIYKEKPPFQYLNWFFNQIYKWFRGLQGSYYDIIVGSATQVTNLEATNVLSDLDNTLVITGTKILFLEGTHILLADLALSNIDVVIDGESPESIIDVSTFQILLSGARQQMKMQVTNAGTNDIQLSAAGSHFEGINVDIASVQITNGASARTSGILSGSKISTAALSDNILMARKTPETFSGQKNFLANALTWGANVSWDLNAKQVAKLTLTGATAQLDNPTNMIDGGTYAIKVTQDATGGRALTFGTAYKWPNGVTPDLSSLGANEYLRINFESNGSVMDGVAIGPFS